MDIIVCSTWNIARQGRVERVAEEYYSVFYLDEYAEMGWIVSG